MLDKLQIVLVREIALLTIKPGSVSSLACSSARGDECGLADVGADVEAGGAGGGVVQGGRGDGAVVGVVFFACGFGFCAGGTFGFDGGGALGGFFCVGGTVPGAAEGGVAALGVGGRRGFGVRHFFIRVGGAEDLGEILDCEVERTRACGTQSMWWGYRGESVI